MNNKTYHITKGKKEKNVLDLELSKLNGYQVNPKAKGKDSIKVDKIVFTDNDISEKIIRKKIDSKIEYLLYKIKLLDTDDGDNGSIEKSLMDAEKLNI